MERKDELRCRACCDFLRSLYKRGIFPVNAQNPAACAPPAPIAQLHPSVTGSGTDKLLQSMVLQRTQYPEKGMCLVRCHGQ